MPADVLIVEDDVALAHAIAVTLRRQNLTSTHVESSEDAIAALIAGKFSVVVLDLLLKEFKSGYYVIEAMRRIPASDRPYVIVVTAAQMTAVANLDRSIVSVIFVKPVQLDVLAVAIRAVVDAQAPREPAEEPSKVSLKAALIVESLRDASRKIP